MGIDDDDIRRKAPVLGPTGEPVYTAEEIERMRDAAWEDAQRQAGAIRTADQDPEPEPEAPPREIDATELCAAAGLSALRAYAIGAKLPEVPPAWERVPEEHRKRLREAANMAVMGVTPERIHEAWLKTRLEQGWRYGPKADLAAEGGPVHPMVRHYAELPETKRQQDALFTEAVLSSARALGIEVGKGILAPAVGEG